MPAEVESSGKFKTVCNECKSIFVYEFLDTEMHSDEDHAEDYRVVPCPVCNQPVRHSVDSNVINPPAPQDEIYDASLRNALVDAYAEYVRSADYKPLLDVARPFYEDGLAGQENMK
jgi:hypothetical protein